MGHTWWTHRDRERSQEEEEEEEEETPCWLCAAEHNYFLCVTPFDHQGRRSAISRCFTLKQLQVSSR